MAVAPVLSMAATGLSAASSIMQGQGQAKADEFQAQQALNAAYYGRVKAAQTGEALTRNMTTALGHIAAVRSSLGADVRSPTTAAVMGRQEGIDERTRAIQMGSIFGQVRSDEQASKMYTDMASRALLGGYLGAAGSIIGGLGGAYKSLNVGGGGLGGTDTSFFGGANAASMSGGSDAIGALPVEPLTGRVAGPV